MFCTGCGRVITEDTQYCPECGKKQFNLPEDYRPYEHAIAVTLTSFVAAFAAIVFLNFIGAGFFAFLFIPFIWFGSGRKDAMHYAMSGACWGFICGAVLSMILMSMGML